MLWPCSCDASGVDVVISNVMPNTVGLPCWVVGWQPDSRSTVAVTATQEELRIGMTCRLLSVFVD
jgi:hypothetical protein